MFSWLKSKFGKNGQPVIIVSGLPRSGTSMMMSMLAAGGIAPVVDGIRQADDNNPRGYYEFEQVKKLKDGDFSWIPGAHGKAVKIITALLEYLPGDHHYQVIFMRRDMDEILASQRAMLARNGKPTDAVSDDTLARLYDQHLHQVDAWLSAHPNIQVLDVDYNAVLHDPAPHLERLNTFLGGTLDIAAMQSVVDRSLYRERNSG
jgi:hypothetical protein